MAAAASSLSRQISEEPTCRICLGQFTRPKMLPCQHTFCQHCLQKYVDGKETFSCPICRHIIANTYEILQQQTIATLSGETTEQLEFRNSCSFNPSEVLEVYCTQCQIPACDQCFDGHLTYTPVPVSGHVMVQSLPSAPIPAARASSDGAAGGTGHHHGNQRLGEHQPKKVKFGRYGSGTGQFNDPWSATVSEEGEIFVADAGNHRIQVFTLQETFVHQFPTVVSGGQKLYPNDVAMDGEGNLWVVGRIDSANFAVQYTKQGRELRKFDLQKTGWVKRGVAVDTRRNHILITHTTEDRDNLHGEVQLFTPDGTLVGTVGQQQGMKNPRYITVDGEGNILISDRGNNCVYVYNKDGQFLFKFGGEGSGKGELKNPRGICTDREGNIIVADRGNRRVEMFDKTGKFLKHIATDMKGPQAVAIATQGQLVVTDCEDDSVSIFQNI